ncbi:MAG: hypothetical protein KTR28_08255 [Micavibrio sp.]|nr:hypothetical protein [Micavibrio sp.]
MAGHTKVEADQETLEQAKGLWDNFIKTSKVSIVIIALGLLAMAAAFVPFSS